MIDLGIHTINVDTLITDLGPVSLSGNASGLLVSVQQVEPVEPWPFSFGIVFYESSAGRELGSSKVFGHVEGEFYSLPVRRAPLVRNGRLKFDSRHYNLGWVQAKTPPVWKLRFGYEEIEATQGTPDGGDGGVAAAFADVATGVGLELIRVVFTSP